MKTELQLEVLQINIHIPEDFHTVLEEKDSAAAILVRGIWRVLGGFWRVLGGFWKVLEDQLDNRGPLRNEWASRQVTL